ncbi:hypothetical protein [Alicyclobacillus dauci]|uniref:Copper amine oxidase N-terminal domain-containing protein n=1 Tax=Alicyclobacillus dauci TaxID=1475485 RepID=A0ABY6Z8F0_9BACL|nr:hypothetical protein [Alicyclobacillus dauci]WAH38808.1 hypothetical protein NZD86_10180 [Alicyclobacillus dauci]
MRHKKKKWATVGISALAATGAIFAPGVTFAQSTTATVLTRIVIDNRQISSPNGLVQHGTMYLPIYYVMSALQSAYGIHSSWNGRVWQMESSVSTISSPVSHLGSGNVMIEVNGINVSAVRSVVAADPATPGHSMTTYVPIYNVMQVLKRLNLISTWDGQTWGIFSQVNPVLVDDYRVKNPNMHIEAMAPVQFGQDSSDSLVVESQSTANAPVTVGVVSPNGTVFDTITDSFFPGEVESLPTPNGSIAAIYSSAGAHNFHLQLFEEQNGISKSVGDYSGDNGVIAWVVNGVPMLLTSNRTYSWTLVDNHGNQDDLAHNTLYTWKQGEYTQSQQFDSSVFEYNNSRPVPPDVQAVGLMNGLLHGTASDIYSTMKTGNWSASRVTSRFLSDFKAVIPRLSFLTRVPLTQAIDLQAQTDSTGNITYSYSYGGDQIKIGATKQSDGSFALSSFSFVNTTETGMATSYSK